MGFSCVVRLEDSCRKIRLTNALREFTPYNQCLPDAGSCVRMVNPSCLDGFIYSLECHYVACINYRPFYKIKQMWLPDILSNISRRNARATEYVELCKAVVSQ